MESRPPTQRLDHRAPAGPEAADLPVLDLLPIGVILADRHGSARHANAAWTALTGQNPSWRGHGWLDVLDDDRRDRERETLLAGIHAGRTYDAEWDVVVADGQRRVLHVAAVPGTDVEAAIVVSATDVTAEHDRAALLLEQATHDPLTGLFNRAQFLQFLGHALERCRRRSGQPSAVFFIDVDGLKATNDTLGHAVGDQLLKRVAASVSAAVRPGDVVARYGGDEFMVLCEGLADLDEASTIAARIRAGARQSANGVPAYKLSVGFALADDPDADPAAIIDLADHAMYESRRPSGTPTRRPVHAAPGSAAAPRAAPGHSGQVMRHDDGLALLATAAHELRTPLTAILGFAATLHQHRERLPAAEVDKALAAIERQAQHLDGTIDDLLDIGRVRSATTRPTSLVDLHSVVSDALQLTPAPARVLVHVQPAAGGSPPIVNGDASTLCRLVVNLLTNAYQSGGQHVAVTITAGAGDDHVQLVVEDDGPGVPPAIRSTLFEPFVSHPGAGERTSGTGLGLAIAREIATSLGGHLTHEPARPRGARFVLTLPATPSRA